MFEPRQHKHAICGLQGGGKTYFAKELVKRNNLKVLVFSPHRHDFEAEGDNFYYFQGFATDAQTVDNFFRLAIELCKKGVIDGVLLDEFDMYFMNNFQIGQHATDAFANHRHYDMCMIMITRRPQDIPAKVFEACKNIVCFALQGENARKKFNGIYKGLGDDILSLDYFAYEYYIKQIGLPPKKMPKI